MLSGPCDRNCPTACETLSAIRIKYVAWNSSLLVILPAFSAAANASSLAALESTYCTRPAKPKKLPRKVVNASGLLPINTDGVLA